MLLIKTVCEEENQRKFNWRFLMVLTLGFQNILNPSSMLASDGDRKRCQANLCESFSARRGRGHEYMTHQLMTFKARKQGTP